jgi:hypothetical protein
MDVPDYHEFFEDYVQTFNRVLAGDADADSVRRCYAETFISAGVNGVVACTRNDDHYGKFLREGTEFYRRIGTRRMNVRRVEPQPIDEEHDLVRVLMSSDYLKSGTGITIDFDVTYLLQRRADGPKIFAFVSGDEMALYRERGLVDEQGQPT